MWLPSPWNSSWQQRLGIEFWKLKYYNKFMADAGFNKIQLKQLQGLFDKNNGQTNDSIVHVVDSLSETIENVKNVLNDKIESEIKTLKRDIKDDIRNLTSTMATKYEVSDLRKRVNGSPALYRTN